MKNKKAETKYNKIIKGIFTKARIFKKFKVSRLAGITETTIIKKTNKILIATEDLFFTDWENK